VPLPTTSPLDEPATLPGGRGGGGGGGAGPPVKGGGAFAAWAV